MLAGYRGDVRSGVAMALPWYILVLRRVGQCRQLDLSRHTTSTVGEHRPVQLGQRGPSVDV
jgi:hypothetical protein